MKVGPDYEGDNWAVYNGDCVEVLAGMPDECIDAAVFSSPFSSLYIYSDSERDMGNSAGNDEFLEHHGYFARELYRVMKPGTVICDHVKDTVFYQNSSETGEGGLFPFSDAACASYRAAGFVLRKRVTVWRCPVREMQKTNHERLLYKNIRLNSRVSAGGMPEYIIALRKESRGINVGEPVEHVKLDDEQGAKRLVQKYLPIDAPDEEIERLLREKRFSLDQWQEWASPVWMDTRQTDVLNARFKGNGDERHICPMPLDLIERCLTLYSNPNDVVLDPFNGIGSTGVKALQMRRRYIGVELKAEYAAQAGNFLEQAERQQDSLFDDFESTGAER